MKLFLLFTQYLQVQCVLMNVYVYGIRMHTFMCQCLYKLNKYLHYVCDVLITIKIFNVLVVKSEKTKCINNNIYLKLFDWDR